MAAVRVGAYPGSFNPLTHAHLAIADAAREQCGLERVDLVISRATLGKDDRDLVRIDDRVEVIRRAAAHRPWLGVVVTDHQLIGDIAGGYDLIIVGADKWAQVVDPAWYRGSTAARDAIVTALPAIAFAPRTGHESERPPLLPADAVILDVHQDHRAMSATGARAGRADWMADEARAFDEETGAWTDPDRYRAWVTRGS